MSQPKVFGIGLSKTGTTSLYVALDQLGFRAGTFGHMAKLGLDDWFGGDFTEDYLHEFEAMTDLPLAGFYRSLYLRYPESKFIYTIRNKSDWLKSCEKQFKNMPRKEFARKSNKLVYGTESFVVEKFSETYDRCLDEIPKFFYDKPSQYLLMDFFSGDGWEKLCTFLQKDIPAAPFPNVKPGFRVEKDPLSSKFTVKNLVKKLFRK